MLTFVSRSRQDNETLMRPALTKAPSKLFLRINRAGYDRWADISTVDCGRWLRNVSAHICVSSCSNVFTIILTVVENADSSLCERLLAVHTVQRLKERCATLNPSSGTLFFARFVRVNNHVTPQPSSSLAHARFLPPYSSLLL